MRLLMALLALTTAVSAQPKRIVSTAPSITETLFALGLGNAVVAVSQHCHYPPEAITRPKIGTYINPNVEAILALRPDLVILQEKTGQAAAQLQRVGVATLELQHGTLETVFSAITAAGRQCGVPDRAAKLNADIHARLNAIRGRTAGKPRRSLVFIVGRNPGTLDNLIAVGKGSYLNELIEIAGGVNALANTPLPYPKISLESMIGLNPEVLVDMGDMAETTGVTEAHKRSVVALWSRYPSLKAVARHNVFAVASDIFVVPGPRVVDAVRRLARTLHPEAR
jgi:ABC-type Fe3+-hydroxamate transport system substrate-binding protein